MTAGPGPLIAGAGMTRFTRHAGVSAEALGAEAALLALEDAGARPGDIDTVYCATVLTGPGTGQRISKLLGLAHLPVSNLENTCASGATALREAVLAIRAREARSVLVIGTESLSESAPGAALAPERPQDYLWRTGLVLPAIYALLASRHSYDHGTTAEMLAAVAVKNRAHGAVNPLAHYTTPVSTAEVLGSRPVADPLTRLQCCPKTDGAAAIVLTAPDVAPATERARVRVAASALLAGAPVGGTGEPVTALAAGRAFRQAGLTPADVDVAEVHDAFTIAEITACEDIGFCEAGAGGALAVSGATRLGGEAVTVNPSGGFLARGHPLGASGLAQIAELYHQLTGRAGARQVPGARAGLAHSMGGTVFDLEANACAIHLLVTGEEP